MEKEEAGAMSICDEDMSPELKLRPPRCWSMVPGIDAMSGKLAGNEDRASCMSPPSSEVAEGDPDAAAGAACFAPDCCWRSWRSWKI
jgi:hypothetical protein